MSAIEISRREQAASATREHVRRVAVSAYEAHEIEEPIEGFHGLSRTVLDEPLAGLRAAQLVADVTAGALREWALRARGAGRTWDDVGVALELPVWSHDGTRAEAAWDWLIERRPLAPATQPPPSAVWTCTTCRARVRDAGPFATHPDDREVGHDDDCARQTAALEAFRREEGDTDD
ncbi:hypothetical protein Acsp06_56730 [Actinomycetospora sp. NBRC 106375]|uniref:hypothetical protein n=1 Tax=Actinomycetospora sp. NBRC 106375 TaxID=3032207 RepID=UPI0024A0B528|nr:hypothetical protein [Actinomycetospora sp. NBRC 106375]GLZ49488.1 hypothetical protein Acsp06_56730 [Actinomycetospora sp. NBRC 106375]